MAPQGSYVICTTPRSGSWMLCSILAQTGIAGQPAEFFGPTLAEELLGNRNLAHASHTGEFFEKMVSVSTTANGVFGTKLLANQTEIFIRRAAEHRGRPCASLKEALESAFPNLRYVWLTRKDKVAQAISLYRASVTNRWLAYDEAPTGKGTSLPYDRFAIQRAYQEVIASDDYWDGYFSTHELAPLKITYEEILAERVPVIQHVLRYLGLSASTPIPEPRTVKLASDDSLAWAEEFVRTESVPLPPPKPQKLWAPY